MKLRVVADKVSTFLHCVMDHISGLVAAEVGFLYPSLLCCGGIDECFYISGLPFLLLFLFAFFSVSIAFFC